MGFTGRAGEAVIDDQYWLRDIRAAATAKQRANASYDWLRKIAMNAERGHDEIIESTFATVRHRTRVTRGPGSRAAGLAMAFKLIESAQSRWRAVNAPHMVALVRARARFERGILLEREAGAA